MLRREKKKTEAEVEFGARKSPTLLEASCFSSSWNTRRGWCQSFVYTVTPLESPKRARAHLLSNASGARKGKGASNCSQKQPPHFAITSPKRYVPPWFTRALRSVGPQTALGGRSPSRGGAGTERDEGHGDVASSGESKSRYRDRTYSQSIRESEARVSAPEFFSLLND